VNADLKDGNAQTGFVIREGPDAISLKTLTAQNAVIIKVDVSAN